MSRLSTIETEKNRLLTEKKEPRRGAETKQWQDVPKSFVAQPTHSQCNNCGYCSRRAVFTWRNEKKFILPSCSSDNNNKVWQTAKQIVFVFSDLIEFQKKKQQQKTPEFDTYLGIHKLFWIHFWGAIVIGGQRWDGGKTKSKFFTGRHQANHFQKMQIYSKL